MCFECIYWGTELIEATHVGNAQWDEKQQHWFGFDTNTYDYDRVEEIADAFEEYLRCCPEMFERLVSDSEKPLYDGCIKFTRLYVVLKLYNLKARWSDKSFTNLLTLLKDMLPEDNVLPNRNYKA